MTMASSTGGEDQPLARLLKLSYSLSPGKVSLRQLVPVYNTLLRAVLDDDVQNEATWDDAVLPVLVDLICKGEADDFRSLIGQEDAPERQLLAMQFLLWHVQGVRRLTTILVPMHEVDEFRSLFGNDELREALLDAVFETQMSKDEIEGLSRTSLEGLPHVWACRILVRLHPLHSVPDLLLHHILIGMRKVDSLRPVITWVLPLLYVDDHVVEGHIMDALWSRCVELMKSILSDHEQNLDEDSLVVSGVLCTILPNLLETNFPCSDGDSRAKPLHQQLLWELISYLVHRGSTVTLKGGSFHFESAATDQTLRRRGVYLLRLLAEGVSDTWLKYVMCFETLEMEIEQHLIDQVWDAVAELCVEAAVTPEAKETPSLPPPMSWEWLDAMFSRIFLSETPTLRKLGLFRFLNGNAGIQIHQLKKEANYIDERKLALQQQPKKKHSIKSKKTEKSKAPLSLVSVNFVLEEIIASFDTLGTSIGTNMNFEERGKIEIQDLTLKLTEFIKSFVQVLDDHRLEDFVAGLLSDGILGRLRNHTAVLVFNATAKATSASNRDVAMSQDTILAAVQAFQLLFSTASIVVTFRQSLLQDFATILSLSTVKGRLDPMTILRVLALYPDHLGGNGDRLGHPTYQALEQWVKRLGDSSNVAASCAAAYVQLQLLPSLSVKWDPVSPSTELERSIGGSIVMLAALSHGSSAASSLLWPAIYKGLSGPSPSDKTGWLNAPKATRAMLLLENGCRLSILSGMGNGDLVVEAGTNKMMPPPPNIENILAVAVNFLLGHVQAITSSRTSSDGDGGGASDFKAWEGSRSGKVGKSSATFSRIISQSKILADSYPSSIAVSQLSDDMLKCGLKTLMLLGDKASIDAVTSTSLIYAALSCGANPAVCADGMLVPDICAKLLRLEFISGPDKMSKQEKQTARSVFHYARWGCLSLLLPTISETTKDQVLLGLFEDMFTKALDLVEATPVDALLPLFDTVKVAAESWLALKGDEASYPNHLGNMIDAMFRAMSDISTSSTLTYMLNELCSLIFRSKLLYEEYQRLQVHPESQTPIRKAFLKLLAMAGNSRSYILKTTLCHICAGWLGSHKDEHEKVGDKIAPGLGAIPYRNEVIKILVHKEIKLDESSTNASTLLGMNKAPSGALSVPQFTDNSSIARGFVLVFLSRLPGVEEGLDRTVLTEFLHPLILQVLENACFTPLKSGSSLMTGTEDYSLRIRSWQALCLLARFVTEEVANKVSSLMFHALNENLHGQIRYFVEIFAIQLARRHPAVFGSKYVKEICRPDLSLQQVSSLMVIGGNVIIGRYKNDFLNQSSYTENGRISLHEVLSGVIPWLSSTQGFSRAIAQSMVYELIPLVIDISKGDASQSGDNWYLCSLYRFLDENPEMKRLRKKQAKAFEQYDVDYTCTAEGLLSIPVDESGEANPVNVVDAIKKCLEEVYLEAHEHETPVWKQVEQLLLAQEEDHGSSLDEKEGIVNFQRKIIPMDSLDLALKESRERKLRNVSGRKRRSLVICASLIDKVPNLGGLARTAEIFAAESLVIPDIKVVSTDNFKSLSVGATEWIEIEECGEDKLPQWLSRKRDDGYKIVGLEQTASSVSIEDYRFPEKTVLLLGKEKEGIPVHLLQLVDQCVEIPQLGIIRSLNVHVSGAICIWEYSKQVLLSR